MAKSNEVAEGTVAYLMPTLRAYQFPRLEAAALAVVERGLRLVCIELTGVSSDYPWKVQKRPSNFELVTLLDDSTGSTERQQVKGSMLKLLSEMMPACVVVCGYRVRVMRAAARWAAHRGIPVIMTSDSTRRDTRRYRLGELVKRFLLPPVTAVFVSGSRAAEYIHSLGVPRERVFYGVDVVDNELFARAAEETQQLSANWRETLGLPEELYFLSVNRFIPSKNILRLIRAYAYYAREAGPAGWKLVICGSGPTEQGCHRLISELGLEGSVLLPGFVPNDIVPRYMGLADAYVQASLSESWGLTVNEAMACGLPVLVSSACGCVADLVQKGRNGWDFEPHDERALATLMARVSELSTEDRRAMGEASRQIVAHWGLDRFVQGLCGAIDCALS